VKPESRRWLLLSLVALLALTLRLIYIVQISPAPFAALRLGDAEEYHEWAMRIAAGDWVGDRAFYQAPLYPYFLAVVYKLFGASPVVVRVVHAAIGTGSCVLLAAAGIALFGEYGAIAGALLAIYPPAIFLDGLLEKSVLVTFFTAALLWLVAARQLRYRAVLTGVTLGLLTLTRENALALAVPIALWFLMENRRAAAAFLCGCALVLLPVAARNDAVAGEFRLTTSFGPNLYIGNHAGARGLYEPLVSGHASAADERHDAERLAEAAAGRALSPGAVSAFWTARAFAFIRTEPAAWLRLLMRKLALTFNAVEIADTESQEVYAESSSLLRVLAPLNFSVVLCLAAFGACVTAAAWRRLWFLYAFALVYAASVVAFFVFARFRFPLVPVLLLLAAGGIAAWREPRARSMRRWGLAAAVAAVAFAFLPLENTRADRLSHYVNIGHALLRDPDRWKDARIFYDKALSDSPQLAAAHFGVGMLLAQMHQPQAALPHYRIAVQGWPDNADIHLNFALALSDAGEDRAALDEIDAATRLRDDAAAHVVAGKLLLKQSRFAEALQADDRARAIDPANVDALIDGGVVLTQLQRRDEATERFRLALELDPRSADAHNWLGVALGSSGRLSEAIAEFDRALALDPGHQRARQNLARANQLLHGERQ
jgi:tetratricopeptide (TPR) repeat protein